MKDEWFRWATTETEAVELEAAGWVRVARHRAYGSFLMRWAGEGEP